MNKLKREIKRRSEPEIWHIYYGTRGTAGSYIDCLQKVSLNAGFKSYAFVSSRYCFLTERVKKIFFPLTERTEKRSVPIKLVRYLELLLAYKWLTLKAVISRPVVNLNLIDDLSMTYYFFRALKFFGLKVLVTCHDVLSHNKGETWRRNRMYLLADRLIVHSSYAKRELARLVGDGQVGKIVQIPFPSSPYTEMLSTSKMDEARQFLGPQVGQTGQFFLFIGIVRTSKGIDTLIDAWEAVGGSMSCKLVIAGKWNPQAAPFKKRLSSLSQCVVIDRYLKDEEFVYLIENARFTILPYRDYSHSAVLFACGWNNGAVIVSDIDLFEDILPGYDLRFPAGDSTRLMKLLNRAAKMEIGEIEEYRQVLARAVKSSALLLEEQLESAFRDL